MFINTGFWIFKMKIGIANSVYKKEGYNHLKTLELAINLNLEYIQPYLNSYNLKNTVLLKKIKEISEENKIEIITHMHGIPSEAELSNILDAHNTVLENQKYKKTVIHFEESLGNCNLIERLNKLDITPHIENFHYGFLNQKEIDKHNSFVNYVLKNKQIYEIGAVLDFGRYFNAIKSMEDSKNAIFGAYKRFVDENIPVFFHTFGKKSFKERDWTSPASKEDIIPQKEIVKKLLSIKRTEGPIIIESEKISDAVNGVMYLRKLLRFM